MKRSLSIVLSLLLTCVILLTSCNNTIPDIPPMLDEVETEEKVETEIKTEETEAKAEVEEKAEEAPAAQPEAEVDTKVEEAPAEVTPAEPEVEIEIVPEEEPVVIPEETDKVEEEVEEDEEIEEDEDEVVEEDTDADTDINIDSKDEDITEAGQQLKDNIPAAKTYKGVMHYPATTGETIDCDIDFVLDYKTLLDGNNKTYSQDLAKLSILYASDIYSGLYVEFTSGATGGKDTATNLGSKLGLKNVKSYKISASSYSVDKNDVTEFFVGHKNIIYKGVVREVIIVAVRGTNETNAEWSSNFDVGADTDEYYEIMGANHPHWKNKANHKGFDVAANRVYEKLESYIASYVDADAETTILFTGHSRGAAIANILGQMYTDNSSYKTFAYTFAAPNTTTAKNAANYKNIFNIINKDDIIPYLPLKEWGFTNYGVTKSISVKEAYGYEPGLFGKEKEGTFKWFTGVSYNDDGGTQRTLDCFAALATCREDLYVLDKTSHGKMTYTGLLGLKYNKTDATAKMNEVKTKLKNENLLKFCEIYLVKSGTKYYVEVNYCPAFFMQMLSNMTTGVGDLLGYTLGTKYNDAKLSFIASSGKAVVGGMEHPHMQPTYYLIARNNFLSLDQLNK